MMKESKNKMDKMEKAKQVCELHLEGKTKEEIAEAAGCSPTSINHYLRIGGIRQARSIEHSMPMIIKLRKEDKKLKEIAEITGFSMKVISAALNKRGMGYKKHDLDFNEPVIDMNSLTYADRKPKVFEVEYDGKQYVDITELCGI